MNHSKYQLGIFDFVENDTGNGAGIAVAGSGKTTTAVESMSHINRIYDVCFTTFGKDIATELSQRTGHMANVSATTYNAFGWKLIREQMSPLPKLETGINQESKTIKTLRYGVFGAGLDDNPEDRKRFYRYRYTIDKIVSMFKSMACFDVASADIALEYIKDRFNYDIPDEDWFYPILMNTFELCINNHSSMDWDDQKYMPLKLGLDFPEFDYIIIDEFQDTNLLESMLMMNACKNGRKLVIGDPDQSIYGFRGATPDNMSKFIQEMNAKLLPLSICYRCPKQIVLHAQSIVPHIEPWEHAIEGTIDTISKDKYREMIKDSDMVICRTTDQLVKSCLQFYREGRDAYVKGKDLGEGLINLIKKIENYEYMSIMNFNDALQMYVAQQIQILTQFHRDGSISLLEDQIDTINTLIVGCDSPNSLIRKIESIFKEKGKGIAHMTIHKSKGLQTGKGNNLFFLRPDLIPHKRATKEWQQQEEKRLKYVGITRTQNDLFYVRKDPNER